MQTMCEAITAVDNIRYLADNDIFSALTDPMYEYLCKTDLIMFRRTCRGLLSLPALFPRKDLPMFGAHTTAEQTIEIPLADIPTDINVYDVLVAAHATQEHFLEFGKNFKYCDELIGWMRASGSIDCELQAQLLVQLHSQGCALGPCHRGVLLALAKYLPESFYGLLYDGFLELAQDGLLYQANLSREGNPDYVLRAYQEAAITATLAGRDPIRATMRTEYMSINLALFISEICTTNYRNISLDDAFTVIWRLDRLECCYPGYKSELVCDNKVWEKELCGFMEEYGLEFYEEE